MQLLPHLFKRTLLALDFRSFPLPWVGRPPIFGHTNEHNVLGDVEEPRRKDLGSLNDVWRKAPFPAQITGT